MFFKIQNTYHNRKPKPFYLRADTPAELHTALAERSNVKTSKPIQPWVEQRIRTVSEAEFHRNTHPQLDL